MTSASLHLKLLTFECDRSPDSSRSWPAPVQVGEEQPSFDKQHIRDYLKAYGLEGKSDVSHFSVFTIPFLWLLGQGCTILDRLPRTPLLAPT